MQPRATASQPSPASAPMMRTYSARAASRTTPWHSSSKMTRSTIARSVADGQTPLQPVPRESRRVGRPLHREARAEQAHAPPPVRPGSLGHDLADVQAGQRIGLGRSVEGDVGGVVRADEELAAGGRQTTGGPHQVRVDAGQVAALVAFEHPPHRQDRERDLRVLVLAELARALPDHLQVAQRRPVGAVRQDADVGRVFLHLRRASRRARGRPARPIARSASSAPTGPRRRAS